MAEAGWVTERPMMCLSMTSRIRRRRTCNGERRAGLHRRAVAPARLPACSTDPACRARVQRRQGRGHPRHHARVGEQRDAARPRGVPDAHIVRQLRRSGYLLAQIAPPLIDLRATAGTASAAAAIGDRRFGRR